MYIYMYVLTYIHAYIYNVYMHTYTYIIYILIFLQILFAASNLTKGSKKANYLHLYQREIDNVIYIMACFNANALSPIVIL